MMPGPVACPHPHSLSNRNRDSHLLPLSRKRGKRPSPSFPLPQAGEEGEPSALRAISCTRSRARCARFPVPGAERAARDFLYPEPSALRARLIYSGFTLIEILVVLVVISIVIGLVTINLSRDPSDVVRDEAQRLALFLQAAQQESILDGRPYAAEIEPDGYHFLRETDDGALEPLPAGSTLGPRTLAVTVTITAVRVEGVSESDVDEPGVIFEPSGSVSPFTVVLESGDARWYVHGRLNGQISASNNSAPS